MFEKHVKVYHKKVRMTYLFTGKDVSNVNKREVLWKTLLLKDNVNLESNKINHEYSLLQKGLVQRYIPSKF
jgi:hypothetical protein